MIAYYRPRGLNHLGRSSGSNSTLRSGLVVVNGNDVNGAVVVVVAVVAVAVAVVVVAVVAVVVVVRPR